MLLNPPPHPTWTQHWIFPACPELRPTGAQYKSMVVPISPSAFWSPYCRPPPTSQSFIHKELCYQASTTLSEQSPISTCRHKNEMLIRRILMYATLISILPSVFTVRKCRGGICVKCKPDDLVNGCIQDLQQNPNRMTRSYQTHNSLRTLQE